MSPCLSRMLPAVARLRRAEADYLPAGGLAARRGPAACVRNSAGVRFRRELAARHRLSKPACNAGGIVDTDRARPSRETQCTVTRADGRGDRRAARGLSARQPG